jgi:Domain of unknown function (DUF4113)
MRAIDQLNAQFGRCTIGFGTAGERQAWSLRREFTPLRFTRDWNELLRAFKAEPHSLPRPVRASHAVTSAHRGPSIARLISLSAARFRPADINQFLESKQRD